MTIASALAAVDALKPNAYTAAQKIAWLDECEKRVLTEVISNHELTDAEEALYGAYAGYDSLTDTDTELLVPDPYSVLYRWWLEANIDLTNMELGKYNNSTRLYKEALSDFAGWWLRTHMPIYQATRIEDGVVVDEQITHIKF